MHYDDEGPMTEIKRITGGAPAAPTGTANGAGAAGDPEHAPIPQEETYEFLEPLEMQFFQEAQKLRQQADQIMAFVVGQISVAHRLSPEDVIELSGRIIRRREQP